ncbi:MAG: hypothetical protein IPG87_00820 [Saprospiraceae bacterium]|nr:hypothetical protein [Candidatus Vicinibacter affinis]
MKNYDFILCAFYLFCTMNIALANRLENQNTPSLYCQFSQPQLNSTICKNKLANSISDSSQYATIYVYRLSKTLGMLASFDLHTIGGVICKVKNKSKFEIRIYKEGPLCRWMGKGYFGGSGYFDPNKPNVLLNFNIKYGEKYYVECTFKTKGKAAVVLPEVVQVTNEIGEQNYMSLSESKKVQYNANERLEELCKTIKASKPQVNDIYSTTNFETGPSDIIINNISYKIYEYVEFSSKNIDDSKFLKSYNSYHGIYKYSDRFASYLFEKFGENSNWKLTSFSSFYCLD